MTPYELTSPNVGLIELTPQKAAGIRSDPSVSEPSAAVTMREASAAALPPLDPPVISAGSHGLPHCGVTATKANSSVWVCPRSTIPALANPAQSVLSPLPTLPATTFDEAVTGRPFTA